MTERGNETRRKAGEFFSSLMKACGEGKAGFPCCGVSGSQVEESESKEEILNRMGEFCSSFLESCREGRGGFPSCGTPTGEGA